MTVAITRLDVSAADLREAAARTQDAKAARRMLAIALLLEGWSREAAAEACAMDRQTLRDWVHRYNEFGLDGLSNRRRRNGPSPCLSGEQQAKVADWVEQGPGSGAGRRGALALCRSAAADQAGVCRPTARAHGGQAVAQAVVPAPLGAAATSAKQARGTSGFQREFPTLVTAALPPEAAGKPVEIWFTDEARVGQQGTITRVWAKRGSRPRAPRDRRYEWAYLFGAVCPERSTGAAIIMPEVNIEAMNEHLAEISRRVSAGAIALLVLDGAGWHSSPRLTVPDNIALLPLPPYAPELNPVENVWEFLRANLLSHRVWDTYEAILEACCDAL